MRAQRRQRVAGVAIVGLLGLAGLQGCRGDANAEATSAPDTASLGVENIVVASLDTISSGPMLSGELSPEESAQVRAQVGGSVVEIFAEQGQTVRRGQVLARIDDAPLRDAVLSARSAFRTAESNLVLARRNGERSETLGAAGAVADREVEQAQLGVTSAEGALADARARLTAAQDQLAKATLRSPIDGVVAEQPVNAGDVVSPGTLVYTVVNPRSMRLEASVPVDQLSAVRPGTPVRFRVAGYDEPFEGEITRVNPAVDPVTRQVRIYAAIPNRDRPLVAGLFAEGRVSTERRVGLAVPDETVNARGIRPTVLRVRGGVVERVEVATGERVEARGLIEIVRGLAVGDTLLRGNAQNTPVGAAVRVTAGRAADSAAPATLSE